jgi:hypothetical protein
MLVTCYYDIYNKPHLFIEYIYHFYDLAASGIPITVFTEEKYVSKFRIFGSNVNVITAPLETFELYNIGKNYERDLPANRNLQKLSLSIKHLKHLTMKHLYGLTLIS